MNELQNTELLIVLAEVSAAFIGFSLVIGLLQQSDSRANLRKQAMHSVAELAMISGGGSLVVLILAIFDFPTEVVWRSASAIAALLWAVTFHGATIRYATPETKWYQVEKARHAGWLSTIGIILLTFNSVISTGMSEQLHILGLFLALCTSGFLFLFSTFLLDSDIKEP